MIVVSDSGPLIALAKIGKLELLRELFGEIITPRAVWIEVVEKGRGRPGSREVSEAGWIKVQDVNDRLSVEILVKEIEIGEAEAIVLSRELNADLLILDEKILRIIAKSLGIKVAGTLALLFIAKEKGLLEEDIDSLMLDLRAKGVRFSEKVVDALRKRFTKT
jgi:predicted nucleic acid-binding protein